MAAAAAAPGFAHKHYVCLSVCVCDEGVCVSLSMAYWMAICATVTHTQAHTGTH